MCLLQKTTYLEWGNAYDDWYIIPTIEFNFNSSFSIMFNWLKISYCHTWRVITFKEEDARASIHYKIERKEDEPSSV